MKNLKIALSLLILICITSCDDFLSEKPDNRTEIDTPEKIKELLVEAYPQMSYFEIAETMSDNVFDSGLPTTIIRNEQNYNWEINTDATDIDTQAYYWDACYKAIAHANKALEAIEELGSPASLNPQKGEALMARAYSHFMLVSLWSKRYNPATADTDLGVPYVTKPETELITKYKRNTLAEVYAFLEKDIEEGLKYVTNDYKEPKFHFNVAASKAFASRFYLVKGNWDKVIELSDDLGSRPSAIRDFSVYEPLSVEDQQLKYGASDVGTNLLIVSANTIVSRVYHLNRFNLSGLRRPEIFGTSTNLFGKAYYYNFYSSNGSITLFLPKFYEYFKYSNVTAGIGDPYVAEVLLSNDEFFLNRIEAHVMKGDIATATGELEYFLATRTPTYNPTTDKLTEARVVAKFPVIADEYTPFYTMNPVQTSYVKAIAETRRRDFIHEGLRWFDIKRFNLVVRHETSNKPANILVKDDNRRALQIPLHASSTGIELNPR
ncbi:RagB/SusD family nutrient uptake outer membrane protein [Flavobacterium chungangensis]|uniref:RagB/SusD family nutrient uptake outer membrane protein n=1 Tax=Flavobacterium chungangensis TaxID=2708132 RepID=A0ABV8ZHZ9_9FLAO